MKALSFKIPKNDGNSLKLQQDQLNYFYDSLHYHPEIQITLILEGKGKFIIGGKRGEFSKNDLFIIAPNDPHVFHSDKIYYENKNKLSHSLSIFFSRESFGKSFFDLPELKSIGNFISEFSKGIFIKSVSADISSIVKKMFKSDPLKQFQLFINLLEKLSLSDKKTVLNPEAEIIKTSKNADEKLLRIYEYILQNFKSDISLEKTASIANMSIPSLCRYIKKRTRKTFTELVNDLRISEAQKLLIKNENPITEIAFASGFNNLSNFNRKFKKLTGKTPGEYRKA